MKALKCPRSSGQPIVEVELARIRLARAESQLKSAKAQSRLAKRRRKEARQAARSAKKRARLAKREVAEAKLALADAEDKLARSGKSAIKAKPRKRPAKKPAAFALRKKTAQEHASPALKPLTQNRPKPVPAHTVAGGGGRRTITVPGELDAPEPPPAPTSHEDVP